MFISIDGKWIEVRDGWQVNDFLVLDVLLSELESLSRAARYRPPEALRNSVDWLCWNLRDLDLTRDEALELLYQFSFMVDAQTAQ